MNDNSTINLDRFLNVRGRPLDQRFPGTYRAIVVETNDPLDMHRIRFKCPEMHDYDLKPEECPWAVSQFNLGGRRSGAWTSPCIGDWVWITFEKQHPYGPVWTGFCTPTRRKFYPYPSVYGITPLPVDAEGKAISAPNDYNKDYLPKDSRPMSNGLQDRYGNLDLSSAIGFFPVEHKAAPPSPDNDPLQSQTSTSSGGSVTPYKQTSLPPEMNNPDGKFMARISKYGHIMLMGDQGYHWQKPDGSGSSTGEFYGDVEKDEEWEIARWKYLQKLINEDATNGADQRRMMSLSRYGHKFEMRDVGWNKTRKDEYGEPRTISDSTDDQRWIKVRTKGGMLFQMSDIGFDAEEDTFVKRKLLDEIGTKTEKEDEYWTGDARWMR
ncbi:MAG: phage baseplate assembly protein V, partial [Candidatus Cloacimonetes bacterium]|nr:phage baseplate assembly protein V [Candidatus Cloacimonadota bacterium]